GEIISPENSRGGTTAEDHARAKSSSKRRGTSDHSDAHIKHSRPQAMSKSPSPKRKRRSCAGRTTYASDGRSSSERTWTKERSKSAKNRGCRTEAHYSVRDRRRRPRSSSSDWDPHENPSGSRRGAERTNRNKRGVASKFNRRARNSILEAPKDDTSRRSRSDKRIEQQQNVRRSSRRSSRSVTKTAEVKSKEDHSRKRSNASTTSCTLSKTLFASKACISVSCDYTSKESNIVTVNHDVIMKPLRVEVESVDAAAATVMEEGVRTSADTSPAADAEVCAIESLSSTWKDSDFLYEDYDILTPRPYEAMEFDQFDRLKTVLLPNHADVLVLLSLLADEAVLPPELLTSPLRRAYHGAVQMLLAIEAYCHGTRSRSSNTRSLLKTIGSMAAPSFVSSGETFVASEATYPKEVVPRANMTNTSTVHEATDICGDKNSVIDEEID
ncbi:hypothetical protein TELCIR_06174, partial [Teladorsagia circumcincta]